MANKPLQSIKFPGLSDTYTTPQVDATLTTTGAAADAKKVGDEITSVKQDLSEKGLSDAAKTALLACFEHVAWVDEHGQDYYDALETALYQSPQPPEWGDDYTWLYNPSDDGLLSARTDIVATTIGTGCVESLNDGILNLYVPENTNQIIRYNLNQSTNSNAKITAKVRFKDVPIVTGAAGFRLQVSNGVGGTQIMEHRIGNQDPVFAYYESSNYILLNNIVTFDEWHIISVELSDNKQTITVDGVKVAESSTLSTNYCTLNSIIAQNVVDATNEHELDVDVAWITYKNND